LTLVRHVRESLRGTEVMMITGYATVEGAAQAVRTGAEEYLAKPFTDEELLTAVSPGTEQAAGAPECRPARARARLRFSRACSANPRR